MDKLGKFSIEPPKDKRQIMKHHSETFSHGAKINEEFGKEKNNQMMGVGMDRSKLSNK